MSFLGGINLGSVYDRAVRTLTRDLELQRNYRRTAEGYPYPNGADFVLRHGKLRQGRELPAPYAHLQGRQQGCYHNSLQAAIADPSLRYCEGYWLSKDIAILHGWCIGPDDGVVEVTFSTDPELLATEPMLQAGATPVPWANPDGWAYWGVTFDTALVTAHHESPGAPLLTRGAGEIARLGMRENPENYDDYHDFPILSVPYDPNRQEMP